MKKYLLIFLLFMGTEKIGWTQISMEINDDNVSFDIDTPVYKTTVIKENGKTQKIIREEIRNDYGKHIKDYEYKNNSETETKDNDDRFKPIVSTNTYHSTERIRYCYTENVTFSFGYARLFVPFDSNFNTNIVHIENWNHEIEVGGSGYSSGWYSYNWADDIYLGGRLSMHSNNYINNSLYINDYYVLESVNSRLLMISLEIMQEMNDYLYTKAGVGLYYYNVNTSIQSNLPQYIYNCYQGGETLFNFDAGVGLKWPANTPLQINAEACFYLPIEDDTLFAESIAQFMIGIKYQF